MGGIEGVSLRELFANRDNEYARVVVDILYVALKQINNKRGLEEDGIVDHAFMTLRRRLEKELAGELTDNQPRYGHLPANSEDFRRIAYTFLFNAIRDLASQEEKHYQQRQEWDDSIVDPRGIDEDLLEREEEIKNARLAKIYQLCTPVELSIVEEFRRTSDCNQVAINLGTPVNTVHQALSRLRSRMHK